MHVTCLTVEQRERFNELANRDMEAETVRAGFDQEQWFSNQIQIMWMTTKQMQYLLSVWHIITP